MHFPATFPVAPGSAGIAETSSSVVISLVCQKETSRGLWLCGFLASRVFDRVGKPRGWEQRESD